MDTKLRTDEFDYHLPEQLIAQEPLPKRDNSRLMVLNRSTETIAHRHFYDIVDYFAPGDVLILNHTRVIPARLQAFRKTGASVEVFLLHQKTGTVWETLVKPGRKVRVGETLHFSNSTVTGRVLDKTASGGRLIEFNGTADFFGWLEEQGHMPLPPYIKRPDTKNDQDRYQTIFARERGAVAAPTAGLHFTPEILDQLQHKGIQIGSVVLHVGLGTFRPIQAEFVTDHRMDAEFFDLSAETAQTINQARINGHRIIATGTTVVRSLESAETVDNLIQPTQKWTDIFIYPPYQFRWVDHLITNFHLPQSTLLMLVSAIGGQEFIRRAYQEAIAREYRFYSYGDAMLIL